jgi:hypothetical protein
LLAYLLTKQQNQRTSPTKKPSLRWLYCARSEFKTLSLTHATAMTYQRLQTIYHTTNSTRRTRGCCGSKRHRETSWVSGNTLALTQKRRKNSGARLISRKRIGENTLMISHVISLRLRIWPWKLHRAQASRPTYLEHQEALILAERMLCLLILRLFLSSSSNWHRRLVNTR